MVGWAFAVALLVLVLAFELLVVRYLTGDRGVNASPGRTAPAEAARVADVEDETATDAGSERVCECGAVNDAAPAVRYCRRCLARLD